MGQELQKSHFPKVTRLTVDPVPCDWLRRSSSYYPVLPSQEETSGRLWSLRHFERLSTVYAGHFKRSKRNVPSGAGRTRPRCPVVLAARKRLSLLTWEWQILVIGVLTVFVRRCTQFPEDAPIDRFGLQCPPRAAAALPRPPLALSVPRVTERRGASAPLPPRRQHLGFHVREVCSEYKEDDLNSLTVCSFHPNFFVTLFLWNLKDMLLEWW